MSGVRWVAVALFVCAGLLGLGVPQYVVAITLLVLGWVLCHLDRQPGTAEQRAVVEMLLDQATVTGVREMYRSGRLPRDDALATIRAILDVTPVGAADILDRPGWPPVGRRR